MARNPQHQRNNSATTAEEKDHPESNIRALMPGRFLLRPNVAPNRFTCRHPKHVRCSCHGAAAPPPQKRATTTTTTKPSVSPTDATSEYPAALQRLKDSYQRTLVQMLFAVRSFPDAAAAVQRILKAAPQDHQPVTEPHV